MWRLWTLLLVAYSLIVMPCDATAAHGDDLSYDQIEFTVQVDEELPNDLAEVIMAVQSENRDPARLANEINDAMAWALDQAHTANNISVQNGSYQTYPVYDKSRLDHWRGIQTLILRSKKIESLNTLVGTLQQRLLVKGMRFTVSQDQLQASEKRLIDQALDQFKSRALRIQNRLGAKGYNIVTLRVGASNNPTPIPMEGMAMARAETVAPLADEAGTSRQSLSVHAVIQLRF